MGGGYCRLAMIEGVNGSDDWSEFVEQRVGHQPLKKAMLGKGRGFQGKTGVNSLLNFGEVTKDSSWIGCHIASCGLSSCEVLDAYHDPGVDDGIGCQRVSHPNIYTLIWFGDNVLLQCGELCWQAMRQIHRHLPFKVFFCHFLLASSADLRFSTDVHMIYGITRNHEGEPTPNPNKINNMGSGKRIVFLGFAVSFPGPFWRL